MQKAPHVTDYLTRHCADDEYGCLRGFEAQGGYRAAHTALREMTPQKILDEVRQAGLQGRGGAGFCAGLKWSFMPAPEQQPSYLVCNADESEPGSFKDRLLLERAPHQLLEGILLAARAIGAQKSFIYIRGEYAEAARVMQRAVDEAHAKGYLGDDVMGSGFSHDVVVVRGAGSYICGEETALLESLEGKRGHPRVKPPFPAQRGAFDRPSTVNNVETLCHVPHIIGRGAAWFRSTGTEKSPGTTLFGVSGHVVRPGLFELPLGTPLDEIIFEHAGGVADGRKVKGVIPGGLSMPILPAGELDVAMANEFLQEKGSALGTGGIIVMDDRTCMVRTACVISEFYRAESCGQCGPCREGTAWINDIVTRVERGTGTAEDLELLVDICDGMEGQTICAFADAAAWPVRALLKHFYADFERHVREGVCSFSGSFQL